MTGFCLQTPRLILRNWEDRDLDPFAAMCADPKVMETLGPVMDRDATAGLINRVKAIAAHEGFTFWALERQEDGAFLGWCGLIRGSVGPIDGKVEIGWRLGHAYWGQGYAREAAIASLDWAFVARGMERIWAITARINNSSWGLMERLGMARHPDLDFDHPKVADNSPLKPHIIYSIGREQWQAQPSSR